MQQHALVQLLPVKELRVLAARCSRAAGYSVRGKAICAEGCVLHAEVKKSSKGGGPGQWSAWKATEMAKVFHFSYPSPVLVYATPTDWGVYCICSMLTSQKLLKRTMLLC